MQCNLSKGISQHQVYFLLIPQSTKQLHVDDVLSLSFVSFIQMDCAGHRKENGYFHKSRRIKRSLESLIPSFLLTSKRMQLIPNDSSETSVILGNDDSESTSNGIVGSDEDSQEGGKNLFQMQSSEIGGRVAAAASIGVNPETTKTGGPNDLIFTRLVDKQKMISDLMDDSFSIECLATPIVLILLVFLTCCLMAMSILSLCLTRKVKELRLLLITQNHEGVFSPSSSTTETASVSSGRRQALSDDTTTLTRLMTSPSLPSSSLPVSYYPEYTGMRSNLMSDSVTGFSLHTLK